MERIAGILYTSLHGVPESHDMLLAATIDPLATLWNAIGTENCATQTLITGVDTLAHSKSLRHAFTLQKSSRQETASTGHFRPSQLEQLVSGASRQHTDQGSHFNAAA